VHLADDKPGAPDENTTNADRQLPSSVIDADSAINLIVVTGVGNLLKDLAGFLQSPQLPQVKTLPNTVAFWSLFLCMAMLHWVRLSFLPPSFFL
jgi:hypothetical protein